MSALGAFHGSQQEKDRCLQFLRPEFIRSKISEIRAGKIGLFPLEDAVSQEDLSKKVAIPITLLHLGWLLCYRTKDEEKLCLWPQRFFEAIRVGSNLSGVSKEMLNWLGARVRLKSGKLTEADRADLEPVLKIMSGDLSNEQLNDPKIDFVIWTCLTIREFIEQRHIKKKRTIEDLFRLASITGCRTVREVSFEEMGETLLMTLRVWPDIHPTRHGFLH